MGIVMESTTPTENTPDNERKPSTTEILKKIAGWVFWTNVIGVVLITVTSMLLGGSLIGSFMDSGAAQAAGFAGLFLTSLTGAICTMLALDGFVAIAIAMVAVIYVFVPRRKPTQHRDSA